MKACRFALAAGGRASVPAQFHAYRASVHAQSRALSAAAAETPKRTFQLLTPELAEGTASCVAETFSHKDEPLTWALNLRRHHWHSLTIPFIERAANSSQPLSVVCLNETSGKVDGACLMEDWLAPRPLAYRGEHLGAEWHPVRAIFAELHNRFMDAVEVPPRERGHMLRVLYFSGVHPDARRSGVIAGLWSAAVDVARANGYTSVTAQASSEATRKMLHDELGFAEVAAVPFADFSVGEGGGGGGGGGAGGAGGYSGLVFRDLEKRSPNARLSIHRRAIPSNLY